MEEISDDFLDELLAEPEKKGRKPKTIERDHRTWFYVVTTHLGQCSNPDCLDDRKKPSVMVWTKEEGIDICRICFLGGWLNE
jgi:hypothetical protein